MGWDLDTTIGKLHRFWWWCLDFAPDGDLRKFNDGVLAGSVGLATSDGSKFVEAMVEACWLDRKPYFRVHDWWDYVGTFLKIKFKNYPLKWQAVKNAYAENGSKGSSKGGSKNDNQPTNPPTYQPTRQGLVGREEDLGEEMPEKSLDGDFSARPYPAWALWVDVCGGMPPNPREAVAGDVLARLEAEYQDESNRGKMRNAMALFRRNAQIKNKTLENFVNSHFNTCLAKARPEVAPPDEALTKAWRKCDLFYRKYQWDKNASKPTRAEILEVRANAAFLQKKGQSLPEYFEIPELDVVQQS